MRLKNIAYQALIYQRLEQSLKNHPCYSIENLQKAARVISHIGIEIMNSSNHPQKGDSYIKATSIVSKYETRLKWLLTSKLPFSELTDKLCQEALTLPDKEITSTPKEMTSTPLLTPIAQRLKELEAKTYGPNDLEENLADLEEYKNLLEADLKQWEEALSNPNVTSDIVNTALLTALLQVKFKEEPQLRF